MRPIVSYEDIASTPASHYESQAPPAKKRKTNHHKRNQRNRNRGSHEEEELTHDEIWDDSALIDAWAAANEEYAVRSLWHFASAVPYVYSLGTPW